MLGLDPRDLHWRDNPLGQGWEKGEEDSEEHAQEAGTCQLEQELGQHPRWPAQALRKRLHHDRHQDGQDQGPN